jgi:hypothetical protein
MDLKSFICSSVNDGVTMSDYTVPTNWMMLNEELRECARMRLLPNLNYYPNIFLEWLRKSTTALSPYSGYSSRDSNRVFPGYVRSVTTSVALACGYGIEPCM